MWCTAAAPARCISRTARAIEWAWPQPVSMSTSTGRSVTPVIPADVDQDVLHRGDAQVGEPVAGVGDPRSGDVEGPEPGVLREEGVVGVRRPDDLERTLLTQRLPETAGGAAHSPTI